MPRIFADNDSEFANEEIKEILGSPPKWIIRWGSLLLLFLVGIVLAIAFFVKQYETVNGKVIISSVEKPLELSVPFGTIIDSVLVQDGALIKSNQPILIFKSNNRKTKLLAPQPGYVFFDRLLTNNIKIQSDTTLMHILPVNQTYLVSMIPFGGSWTMIKPGQHVTISTNNFPKQQFGNLTAIVITKPRPYNNGGEIVSLQLENNGLTTYNKKIDLSIPVNATGEIIVGKKRLINALLGF